jgi:hypothetical protein
MEYCRALWESHTPYATSAYAEDGGGISGPDTNDDGMGPDRLFSILKEAVPPPDQTLILTVEELQRRHSILCI